MMVVLEKIAAIILVTTLAGYILYLRYFAPGRILRSFLESVMKKIE